eukprot:ctg_2338.g367
MASSPAVATPGECALQRQHHPGALRHPGSRGTLRIAVAGGGLRGARPGPANGHAEPVTGAGGGGRQPGHCAALAASAGAHPAAHRRLEGQFATGGAAAAAAAAAARC